MNFLKYIFTCITYLNIRELVVIEDPRHDFVHTLFFLFLSTDLPINCKHVNVILTVCVNCILHNYISCNLTARAPAPGFYFYLILLS